MTARAGSIPLLLTGGIVGPILFVAVFLVLGAVQPGYDPIKEHVSGLAFTRYGWVQTLNFVVSGALMVGFGWGLITARGPNRFRGAGIAAAVAGAGLVIAGIYPSGFAHLVGGIFAWLGLTGVCIALGSRLLGRRQYGRAVVALLAGAAVFSFFWLAGEEWFGDTYIGNIAGLMQRISIITGLGVVLALGISARRAEAATART